ncbi:hypothetical protein HXX76_010470 [Chlamydomonas incerta]|uniref:Uncharacterized protein n=1 Tax=Chlamydomonas incerta TaxID=51695 RepID=A0A835VT52_CHLIN|nr:hypothetical protein HXX76_010470 [Chlamydomonas incerta]|eukprot:KAG2428322.1 hypothetical protein HXX76_010470 [Chlamydomonas incerta]
MNPDFVQLDQVLGQTKASPNDQKPPEHPNPSPPTLLPACLQLAVPLVPVVVPVLGPVLVQVLLQDTLGNLYPVFMMVQDVNNQQFQFHQYQNEEPDLLEPSLTGSEASISNNEGDIDLEDTASS